MAMKSKFASLFFLLVTTFIFAKVQGGFVPWFLFYTMALLGFISLSTYFFTLRFLTVERRLSRERCFSGEELEVLLTIRHRSFFPLTWLIVEDKLVEKLEVRAEGNCRILFPWTRQTLLFRYTIPHLPRGVHHFQKVNLSTGDIFGILSKTVSVRLHDEFIVYPRPASMTGWGSLNEKNMGNTYTLNRSMEDVTSVIGVRDYTHGDRFHRIHWKSTARTMQLKTKEFETRVTNDFMFFLDATKQVYRGDESPLFERAIQLTVSLMKHASDRRFSIGLLCNDANYFRLRPSRQIEQLLKGYEGLAQIQADGKSSFIKMVMKEVSYLPVGTTVVCITPTLSDETVRTLHHLIDRKVKIELFWMVEMQELTAEERRKIELLDRMGCSYHRILYPPYDLTTKGGARHVTA